MRNALSILGTLLILSFQSCNKGEVSTLTTAETTNITGTGAISGGTITSEGSGVIISRGVCWSKSTNPSVAGEKTSDGAGAGTFSSELTGLEGATKYFIRAYATNEAGTGYGMAMSFTTLGEAPMTLTYPATVSSPTTATLNGEINANHLSSTVTFEYGTSTNYGNIAAFAQNPVTGNANTNVRVDISELVPETIYHFRIKAVNSIGTMYGEDLQFTTFGHKPTIISCSYSGGSVTEGTLRAIVNPNYMTTVVTFEYGTTTSYGNSILATPSLLTGNLNTGVNATISGLIPGTTYHFRLKAVNELGITYSDDNSFSPPNMAADADGNTYPPIIIGTQIWMAENLKTTKFNDGTVIPNVTDDLEWSELITAGYCWYENDAGSNKDTYGALYNWYAVNSGKLCPTGWHVPSNYEWITLENYLIENGYNYDGSTVDNKCAKALASNSGWNSSIVEGAVGNTDYPDKRNSSGFTALPGGVRDANQRLFGSKGNYGMWWTASQDSPSTAWDRGLDNSTSSLGRLNVIKSHGFSIRCLKDN